MNRNNIKIEPPYPIFLQNDRVLLYDADVAYLILTKHRLLGKLIGASSFFSLQNKFNVLPLLLVPEVVTVGLEKGIFKLYSDPFSTEKEILPTDYDHHIGMKSSKITKEGKDISSEWKYPSNPKDRIRYAIFKDLYERGFYISPAMKFGADFLIYESNPLMLHALYMVYIVKWKEKMKPSVVASLTRLALAVHKKILLASVDEMGRTKFVVLKYFSTKQRGDQPNSFDTEAVFSGM